MDPLLDKETEKLCYTPTEKAELLGRHFESKLSAEIPGVKSPVEHIRKAVKELFPTGRLELSPKISLREMWLATRDLPRGRSAGPDKFPAELYHHCPSLHAPLALLVTDVIERALIPGALKQLYVSPLDKPGKDPMDCNSKRPISLLSPLMKLVELLIVRRLLPQVEHLLSSDQYAYQRARSTEVLLSDLDHFATTNRRKNRVHHG